MFFDSAVNLLLKKRFNFKESLDLSLVFSFIKNISLEREILLPFPTTSRNSIFITSSCFLKKFCMDANISNVFSLDDNLKSKFIKNSDFIFLDKTSYKGVLSKYRFLSIKYFRKKIFVLNKPISKEYYYSLVLGRRLKITISSKSPFNVKLGSIDTPIYQLSSNFYYITRYISDLINSLGIKISCFRAYITTTQSNNSFMVCNDIQC
ncbi:hypothetical protein [Candidatus Vidania fulgoroideorum]